jgi:hypothetical protein
MHLEYASPSASGLAPPADERAVGAVVVEAEPALGTVSDFDPLEQAPRVTANTTAVTTRTCDGRISFLLADTPRPSGGVIR